jgi:DNA-directed RNA polymerase subunit H|tara:strand:- start:446 stop:691 length:246 start_codon:yes stop_codon:yes gene_type:complete
MNDNVLWLNKLVPKHVLLEDSEIEGILEPLNVIREQLPKILLKDPALKALDQEAKPGDVVEIHRVSESAGSNLAYRVVVEE